MTDLEASHHLQKFYDVLASIATSLDSIATSGDALPRQIEGVADGTIEVSQQLIELFKQNRRHHADLVACLEKLTESK